MAKETGKNEGLPREHTYVKCVQEMIDSFVREEIEVEETGWGRIN